MQTHTRRIIDKPIFFLKRQNHCRETPLTVELLQPFRKSCYLPIVFLRDIRTTNFSLKDADKEQSQLVN